MTVAAWMWRAADPLAVFLERSLLGLQWMEGQSNGSRNMPSMLTAVVPISKRNAFNGSGGD